jgi:hypothetical protein
MKKNLIAIAVMALTFISVGAFAQTNAATAAAASASFIKGTLNITFNTHQNPPGTKGIQDVYDININVANSAVFHGKMTDRPQIIEGMFNKAITQPRSLKYDVACDVVNPKNPTQTKNIGRMYGMVPISSDGVYNYDKSSLVVDILPMGNAGGFTSKFSGQAAGKPLVRPANWTDMVRETVNINRLVNGKPMTVALKRYDKMDFRNVVIAEGPVQIYQPVTVNGQMYYDYDKNCWFFNNFTVQYAEGRDLKVDRVTGTIRWIEDPNRKSNGLGHYEFDVRVNEPAPDASNAFAAPTDESAFFASDTTVPGLSGTMNYKDTLNANGDTLASAVTIDLNGNNINKQQVMVLGKVIIFAAVIPMNSD